MATLMLEDLPEDERAAILAQAEESLIAAAKEAGVSVEDMRAQRRAETLEWLQRPTPWSVTSVGGIRRDPA